MALSIRIPALLDLVVVDRFEDLDALNRDPRVDRGFDVRGPLVNRILKARLSCHTRARGRPLPAMLAREAEGRPEARADLARRLSAIDAAAIGDDPDVPVLAAYVAGRRGSAPAIGPHVQAVIGRLFQPGYLRKRELWQAACRLQSYLSAAPGLGFQHRLFGRLDRALRDLGAAVGGDPDGIHATGIAVHSLVRSLRAMRRLAADPGSRHRLSPDSIVLQSLRPPERVARVVTAPVQLEHRREPVTPDALLFADLERIVTRHGDSGTALQAGSWAACPAESWVPALLRVVWAEAREPER